MQPRELRVRIFLAPALASCMRCEGSLSLSLSLSINASNFLLFSIPSHSKPSNSVFTLSPSTSKFHHLLFLSGYIYIYTPMAFSRALTASIFLSFLLLHLIDANQMMGMNGAESPVAEAPAAPAPTPTTPIDCGEACKVRCQLSSRPNLCKRACGSCCAECKCVPPGTSGNYDACLCYARLTTRDKIRKCP